VSVSGAQFAAVREANGTVSRLLPKKHEICVRVLDGIQVFCGLKLSAYVGHYDCGEAVDFTFAKQHLRNGTHRSLLIINYVVAHG
jgi:hypothetical protein